MSGGVIWLRLGAILGGLAVAAGAFGAHALRDRLDARSLEIFETAARYQMAHALALLAVGLLERMGGSARLAGGSFAVGTLIFSGSLYALALTGARWLGAITPIGGVAMIVGWVALAVAGGAVGKGRRVEFRGEATSNQDLDRRLRIIESGYGRDYGWDLEYQGAGIAVLSEPRWVEMFWVSYRIEPTSDDPKVREMLHSDRFWEAGDYVFRNRGFRDEVVERAFGNRSPRRDEVLIRGLSITIKEPTLWERARCFGRLRRARKRIETCERLRASTPRTI